MLDYVRPKVAERLTPLSSLADSRGEFGATAHLTLSRDQISRAKIVMGALLYATLIDLSYTFHIAPTFSYLGYHYLVASQNWHFVAIGLAVLPAVSIPIYLRRPSILLCWTIYLVVYVPSVIVPILALPDKFSYLPYCIAIAVCQLFLNLTTRLRPWRVSTRSMTSSAYYLIIWSVIALAYWIVFGALGFPRWQDVSLLDVYETRAAYVQTIAASGSRMAAYAIGLLGNAVNPVLIAIGAYRKKPLILLVGVVGQVALFSVTGYKSIIFSILLPIVVLLFSRSQKRAIGPAFLAGAVMMLSLPILFDLATDGVVFSSITVRRLLHTPGLLSGYYHEFFSNEGHLVLSNSILRALTDYPYSEPHPAIIASRYLGGSSGSANANFWADGFAQFGYLGVFAATIIVAAIFRMLDSGSRRLNPIFAGAAVVVAAFALTNSALLTSLLTHGLGAAIALVWLMPAARNPTSENRRNAGFRRRLLGFLLPRPSEKMRCVREVP
jgi:hypothetical protein